MYVLFSEFLVCWKVIQDSVFGVMTNLHEKNSTAA